PAGFPRCDSKRGTSRNVTFAIRYAPVEREGQTLRGHPMHFRIDLRLVRVVRVIETSTLDFPAHSASGRHHENGFRQPQLRGAGDKVLWRRDWKVDRRLQHHAIRNPA